MVSPVAGQWNRIGDLCRQSNSVSDGEIFAPDQHSIFPHECKHRKTGNPTLIRFRLCLSATKATSSWTLEPMYTNFYLTRIDCSINFIRNDDRNANKNKPPTSKWTTDGDVNRPGKDWLKHNSFHLARIKSLLCVSSSPSLTVPDKPTPVRPSVLTKSRSVYVQAASHFSLFPSRSECQINNKVCF